jgi:hypothetical protein
MRGGNQNSFNEQIYETAGAPSNFFVYLQNGETDDEQ